MSCQEKVPLHSNRAFRRRLSHAHWVDITFVSLIQLFHTTTNIFLLCKASPLFVYISAVYNAVCGDWYKKILAGGEQSVLSLSSKEPDACIISTSQNTRSGTQFVKCFHPMRKIRLSAGLDTRWLIESDNFANTSRRSRRFRVFSSYIGSSTSRRFKQTRMFPVSFPWPQQKTGK